MGLLTAIRDYFTLPQVEQRALSPTQAWARDLNWGGANPSGERVDQGNATALSTVYACVSLIADIISTLPVDTYIKWDGFPKPYRPRPSWLDEPIPNDPSVTRSQHFSQVVLSLMFDGNAFILAQPSVRAPEVLTVLDPVKVRVYDPGTGRLEYYVGPQHSPTELNKDQIVHIPRTRRPGTLRGMSPIDEAAETLGIALAAQRHSGRFYRNGTLMSTIINVPGEMSEEDALSLRDAFSQRHSGENVFRTGVLTGGATATTLGVTPEQAQFLETIKFHVLEVCRLYRVPPMLVGVNDPGAVSYASATEAVKAFHVNTLSPLLQILSQGYKRLMPDDRVYLQFDTNGLLRADPDQRYSQYAIGLEKGIVNRNEVRGWEELPPIPGDGGNIYTVQAQMVTLDSVANPPEEEPDAVQGEAG